MNKTITMLVAALALALPAAAPLAAPASDFRARLPEDEIIYFLLPDRFENGDPRNDTRRDQGRAVAARV